MATVIRDIAPGKDKRGISISPQTGTTTTKLRGTLNYPSTKTSIAKPTPSSTAPQRHTPSYLRPARSPNIDVSKQLGKKPASTISIQKASVKKPTVSRIRSSDKTALTITQKPSVSTNVSRGYSSFSGKTGVSQKMVTGKNVKAPAKDVAKCGSLYGRPISTIKKSSIKEKEVENSTTVAAKEQQISNIPDQKVENSNTSVVPKPELQLQPQQQHEDRESCIPEAEEQIIQAVNNNEKGTDDLVMENQEPLNIEKIKSESNEDDSKIVIAEDSTVSEHQDAPTGIKTDEVEDKLHIEQNSSKEEKLEEHDVYEVIRSNNDENIEDNPSKEDKEYVEEKEVVEVQKTTLDNKERKEVIEVQEIATDRQEEAANGSEENESKETERREVVEEKKREVVEEKRREVVDEKRQEVVEVKKREVVEEKRQEVAEEKRQEVVEVKKQEVVEVKKQEAQNVPPKGKKESAVSNDVIEETASKLREQRKNKVRALASAFETVISLQETKW